MLKEALSAASVVEDQRRGADERLIALANRLRERPPTLALTVARGSSDHAAAYFAYLVMRRLGVPVVSLPMRSSRCTTPRSRSRATRRRSVAVGQSPDLVDTMAALGAAGARRRSPS